MLFMLACVALALFVMVPSDVVIHHFYWNINENARIAEFMTITTRCPSTEVPSPRKHALSQPLSG